MADRDAYEMGAYDSEAVVNNRESNFKKIHAC